MAVTDYITLSSGKRIDPVGGGAGWYAYAGARIWSDEVVLVTGTGEDFLKIHKQWFEENGVDTSGLMVRDANSPKTEITYFENGKRSEVPHYGKEHFRRLETRIEDLEERAADCSGMYLFRSLDDLAFWDRLIALKQVHGFTLMWEVDAEAAVPDKLDDFKRVVQYVDILSINAAESRSLLNTHAEKQILAAFRQMGIPLVYYRRGRQGALMIEPEKTTAVPSIDSFCRVDPTGAGNSSSAAVLVGYCRNRSPYEIGLMGSISAGYMITQFGPPERIDSTVTNEAKRLLQNYLQEHD